MSSLQSTGQRGIVLGNLNSREYEHSLDRQALQALERTQGLQMLVKKLNEYGWDRAMRLQYSGSHFKVTPQNLPDLYDTFSQACAILDIDPIPDLYIECDDEINACTVGVEHTLVAVTAGCVDHLPTEELLFILGHELGHIKSQHIMYHQMATIMPRIGGIIGQLTLGIGGLISTGLQLALLNWYRMSEFSADRAGLLACQDADVAVSCMMKLAGLPVSYYGKVSPQHFIEQSRHFAKLDDTADKLWKAVSVMGETHPWTVMRGAELMKWIESGDYDRVLRRESVITAPAYVFCTKCGTKAPADDRFCCSCGAAL